MAMGLVLLTLRDVMVHRIVLLAVMKLIVVSYRYITTT